ncbi:MAG: phage tail sheath subtilisin-like domain-containing protein [Culturomica sp.]|jgi:phage tail sheath protein FI|nr:phage tail sheath subtilisin-like domain-containing protein [Culturomica sp.]
MGTMKTPGVYIIEKNAFPNSVVEAETAIPVFVGYTEKAIEGTTSILNRPKRISSMGEFHNFFGGEPKQEFSVTKEKPEGDSEIIEIKFSADTTYYIKVPTLYTLYYNMLLFFANGGGTCYVVSVGGYDYTKAVEKAVLEGGIEPLQKEQEPTMVVIPEAINLSKDDCYALQQTMLNHCGNVMKNRFALLDVWKGTDFGDANFNSVNSFREGIGSNFLAYGAAYFPWLESSVISLSDISWENIAAWEDWIKSESENFNVNDKLQSRLKSLIDKYFSDIANNADVDYQSNLKVNLHSALSQNWTIYKTVLETIKGRLNLLPPSAALAGIYTMVDNTRGVWKAPANVSINSVVIPSVNITNEEQEDLNVPMNGKTLNAIRFFIGDGIKVWGARTLDGNSLDWRYVNVRRTMIFLETSIKNAARSYVFEPNTATTWINMKSMIENFLHGIWKRGGLAGASPEDAFSVHVGLGDTMTPEDILEGILRITVLVALSRPAEFIEITFQQQMQKS